jgi:phage shock protein C
MLINKIVSFFEKYAFGVCTWLGNKLGIESKTIRLYFIYLSFFTAGSPVILYFVMAFILENKRYFKLRRPKRKSVWNLQ